MRCSSVVEIRPELDLEHKAVLADWLQARGDPRGELISLELALDQPGVDPGPLLARLETLRAELEPRWIAALARRLQLTPAQLHAFMPGRWYAGLLLEFALCPRAELALGDVATVLFDWILASDASVAVEVVDAGELPGATVLEQLATGPVHNHLQRLVLGDHRGPVGELALLDGQLPALRELEVRGTAINLAGLDAPALEHLRICCNGDWTGLAIPGGDLRCPALTRLELRFGQPRLYANGARLGPLSSPPPPELIPELLAHAELPALRELGLAEFDCQAEFIAALVAAPDFARLRRLSFAGFPPHSGFAAMIEGFGPALASLERIEIADFYRFPTRPLANCL